LNTVTKLFGLITGPNPKIERADMDGSRRKSVIVDRIFWPNGLTIDYMESKIYWADAKHHIIEKATFDGRERKRVRRKYCNFIINVLF
jgi:low-density lipoprotein receptor-related protein 4